MYDYLFIIIFNIGSFERRTKANTKTEQLATLL